MVKLTATELTTPQFIVTNVRAVGNPVRQKSITNKGHVVYTLHVYEATFDSGVDK